VDVSSPFPSDAQTSEAVQPRETSLHDPAVGAQFGAVQGAAAGDRWHDAAGADLVAVDVVVVAPVGEQRVRFAARPAHPATDRRDRIEQRQELGDVVAVAAGQQDRERGAVPVGDEVMFGTSSTAVDQ
jgi:hypothetical protein